jgi:basic membrane protein A
MLYEMLVGKVPFQAETPMAVLLKHIHDPLPLPRSVNPDIPEAIERVVLKAMAKDPEDRFQTAGDLAKALEAASRAAPTTTLSATLAALPPAVPGPWLTKAFPIVGMLAGIAVIVGLGIAIFRGGILGGGAESPKVTPVPTVAPAPTRAPVSPAPTRAPRKVIGMAAELGGVSENAYNAMAWKGIETAKAQLGVEGKYLEAQDASGFAENIGKLINEKADLVVTVGFPLALDTAEAALQNPEQRFAIADYSYPDCWPGAEIGTDCGSDKELPNVLGMRFSVDEAAYLAGYVSAGVSTTGRVGTFGGVEIPGVTDFMDGFALGVDLYNQQHGGDVTVLGWDPYTRKGLFVGNFDSFEDGQSYAEALIEQGTDIILPVAGPVVGEGAAYSIAKSGRGYMIGTDTDWSVTAPAYAEITLTSVRKNFDVAVFEAISRIVDGTFAGGTYNGTLANGGVGIAPYHRLDEEVPIWLQNELEDVRQGIIAGTIQTKP